MSREPLTPVGGLWRGALVGAANVVIIAIAIAVQRPVNGTGVFELMFIIAALTGIQGVGLGALLGLIAVALARRGAALRLAVFGVPAFALLVQIAHEHHALRLLPVGMIPTALAVIGLERWTRWRDAPRIVHLA